MSDDTPSPSQTQKVEGTVSLDHEAPVSDSKPVYKGKPMGFFRHVSAITGYGMTPDAIEEYRRDFDEYYADTLCKRCEDNRDWLIKYNST